MKSIIKILFLSLFALLLGLNTLCQAETFGQTYSNPVFAHDWPDPTVWRGETGVFYSFSTAGPKYSEGRGKFLYSFDLVQWDSIADVVFTQSTTMKLKEIGRELWAPHITQVDGQWLMYLTCYNSAAESSVVVLSLNSTTFPKSDGTHGPWQYVSTLTSSTESGINDTIDPFVITDPDTGKVWLYFGSIGGIHRIELAADGLSLAPEAKATRIAGQTIEQNPNRKRVFESTYLYWHDGYWYFFVSSGLYSNFTYATKVGRSKTLEGPFTDQEGRDMADGYAMTLLSTASDEQQFWGPGGLGGIVTDDQGRTFTLYHSHCADVPASVAGYHPRALMLEQLYWNEQTGWPYFKGNEPQPTGNNPDCSQSVNLPQVIAAQKQMTERYSLFGTKQDDNASGPGIIRYSDGSAAKVMTTY